MKVSGGIVGITLNPSARTRFFLISPELARLAEEAQQMAGMNGTTLPHHHHLSESVTKRQEKNIQDLYSTIKGFANPFAEDSEDLVNFVTNAVLPEKAKQELCKRNDIGQVMFDEFVSQRIQTNNVNIWAPMKKRALHTWKEAGKKTKITTGNKTVELQEDRSLFARMLVVSKSRTEINLADTIGQYEFSVVPRSLFAADGTMLPCSAKSDLMKIIENIPTDTGDEEARVQQQPLDVKVALVDGMAEVQSLQKSDGMKQMSDLAKKFTTDLFRKYNKQSYNEVHIIFDRYDVPQSLKTTARIRRQGGKPAIAYHISDNTKIENIPLKQLLAHTNTKMEITSYLSEKIFQYAINEEIHVAVACGSACRATHMDMRYLASDQEEADTKLLLHALDVTARGATEIEIHSPDTDVFILALRRYPELCSNTSFVTGTSTRHRKIPLEPIYTSLGPSKIAALPGFHAFSGADTTGVFAGKGKLTCWKTFQSASADILSGFANLGKSDKPAAETMIALEKFVCQLYLPGTQTSEVKQLRWWLFRKTQAQSEKLPPTQDALYYAVLRSHYQSMVWDNDKVAMPNLPTPQEYGWELDNGLWKEVMTTQLPAPDAIINLIKCGCLSSKCTTRQCKCSKAGLPCTELCKCADEGHECENPFSTSIEDEDSEDDDSNI